MMYSQLVSTTRPIATLFISLIGLLDELVDFDDARGFESDVLELIFRHLNGDVLVEGASLDDVLVGHLLTCHAAFALGSDSAVSIARI
jgi:hypothetical protein